MFSKIHFLTKSHLFLTKFCILKQKVLIKKSKQNLIFFPNKLTCLHSILKEEIKKVFHTINIPANCSTHGDSLEVPKCDWVIGNRLARVMLTLHKSQVREFFLIIYFQCAESFMKFKMKIDWYWHWMLSNNFFLLKINCLIFP